MLAEARLALLLQRAHANPKGLGARCARRRLPACHRAGHVLIAHADTGMHVRDASTQAGTAASPFCRRMQRFGPSWPVMGLMSTRRTPLRLLCACSSEALLLTGPALSTKPQPPT